MSSQTPGVYIVCTVCISHIFPSVSISVHSNVNPGLINHGLLIRRGTPPIVIIQYLNGIPPINQPFGVY